jgi:hypothetical protein
MSLEVGGVTKPEEVNVSFDPLINSPSYNSGLVSISVLDGVADKFG